MNADLRTLHSEWNALRCTIACHPRHAPNFAQALRSHVDRWRVAFLATHYPAHEWQVESTTITYPYTLERLYGIDTPTRPELPDYITVKARALVGPDRGVSASRTWHAAPDTESSR